MARKKERGNGSGTVDPRKNKQGKIIGYRGSYFAPDGKRCYVSAKRKGGAERALRQAMTDADRGFVFDGGTITLGDYLSRSLTDSVSDTVKATTFERYEQISRLHLKPALGILLQAAHEAEDRLEALYVLAIHGGLRQGELLGLKWDDVDLEDASLQARRTLAITKNGPILTSPKTTGSRRSVKLTSMAIEALKRHLDRQLGEIVRVSSLWSENGLIFASETGEPLNRHNLTRRSFKPLLNRAGLPEIRFHDLRHTCATLLLTRNVNPKIDSEMLGHSTIAITLDTYSHGLPNMRDAAAAAMEEALS